MRAEKDIQDDTFGTKQQAPSTGKQNLIISIISIQRESIIIINNMLSLLHCIKCRVYIFSSVGCSYLDNQLIY